MDHNSISHPDLKDHIITIHETQEFNEGKRPTFANDKSQGSKVWKNILEEFMKALSYIYVILVKNHLPKILN